MRYNDTIMVVHALFTIILFKHEHFKGTAFRRGQTLGKLPTTVVFGPAVHHGTSLGIAFAHDHVRGVGANGGQVLDDFGVCGVGAMIWW